MTRAILHASAFTALAALGTALVLACSTSSSSGGGGASGSYCSAVQTYAQRCNKTDACSQAEVRDCAKIGGYASDALANALQKCSSQISCDDAGGGGMAANQCIQDALNAAPKTAAQQKLAQDYCNVCAAAVNQSTADCVATFFGAADGGQGGPGRLIVTFNDTVVQKLDQSCTSTLSTDAGPLGCDFGFLFCALPIIQQNTYTPPECQPDGGIPSGDAG